jgi:hypothetical protein
MSNKPSKNMSLAIDVEFQEKLKEAAKKRNISTSKLIRDMADKYLSNTDEEVDTVIFKIPNSVKANPEELRKWLQIRVEAVVKALTT